jgi:GMP synthase (glutamine-hydrolysing)
MTTTKSILILQLRPEDATSDSEYACLLKYGGLQAEDTHRIRIEKNGIPDNLNLDNYSAIIVGGSPFDISTPAEKKSAIQNKIEADFNRLLEQVVPRDIPFLGACSGNGLLRNPGYYRSRQTGQITRRLPGANRCAARSQGSRRHHA